MDIICTLGPSTLNEYAIRRLTELGVTLMRINISHTKIDNLEDTLRLIKSHTDVNICIDTEGAQVRTGEIEQGEVCIKENSVVRILPDSITGNEERLSFYPGSVFDQLCRGDIIHIDYDSVMGVVIEKEKEYALLKVLMGGNVGRNKAVTIERDIELSPLTQKDYEAIKLGIRHGVSHVAMSFVNRSEDVECVRKSFENDLFLISKIETVQAIRNLKRIMSKSNAILIDRGDLSRQVPIERIARAQKYIIKMAKEKGSKVYVATNLLESMTKSKVPTRAEINDVFNTLCDGANGLVLAAETAVGKWPVHCVKMIKKIIIEFNQYNNNTTEGLTSDELRHRSEYFLNEPHGGKLVDRVIHEYDIGEIQELTTLDVDSTVLLDAEQIALGTMSPIEGYMNREEVRSVLGECRLPDGTVWPIPITLQTGKDIAKRIKVGRNIALAHGKINEVYATMLVDDVYDYDLHEMCKEYYGTIDISHPGVEMTMRRGCVFISGKVSLIKRLPSQVSKYELSPHEVRRLFDSKGWSKIVGFHTRNVAHRAHEHIQLHALMTNHCDGLFINPVSGIKKEGDYCEELIFKSYEMMINKYYPADRVVLGAFKTYSRFAGPKEAVFTALCRKNYGCTHFIVGRDHTGVGAYYQKSNVKELFSKLGSIGIEPLFYENHYYCDKCRTYVEQCGHGTSYMKEISGSEGRNIIRSGQMPPDWFMRREISEAIIETLKKGGDVFES